MTRDTLAVGVRRTDTAEQRQQSVRTFTPFNIGSGYSRWSLQQKLILDCCTTDDFGYSVSKTLVQGADVYYGDDLDSLFITLRSPSNTTQFVYMSSGLSTTGYKMWSEQQRLFPNIPADTGALGLYDTPTQFGGTLFMRSNNDTVEVLSKYHNGSCMLLWMSDHFGDGWDSLVLTVRAPDTTNDSFSPRCDQVRTRTLPTTPPSLVGQVDPFYVRYCPYNPSDEGVYIVKPFAATKSRFFWEVSWKVMLESTGEWYLGDANTRYLFFFNSTSLEFSFAGSTNPMGIERSPAGTMDVQPCFRCGAITLKSWAQEQDIGDTSFWPFVAFGAPYFISDVTGRTLYFSGRVCDGIATYECYQILPTGKYIMRMGGGLYGKDLLYPRAFANWQGCGVSGTDRDQLIFEIVNQTCVALQVFTYTSTCSVPPALPGAGADAAFGSVSRRLTTEVQWTSTIPIADEDFAPYNDINGFLLP